MNEYKFVGTRVEGENTITTTEYVYAVSERDAVNAFLRDFKPLPLQWEFLGKC